MIRLLLALLLLPLAATAGDVPVDKLPREVRDAVEKRFPGAKIVNADIDRLGAGNKPRTVLTYELTCTLPDREIEVLVTEDGKVLDEELKVTPLRGEITLSKADVREDFDFLEKSLAERFAYLDYGKVAFPAAPKRDLTRSELALEVQKVMARFIDGHADVSGLPEGRAFLPFLVESTQGRFVAFKPDRSGFVEDGFPWIESIDGRAMKDWVKELGVVVPQGSPSYTTRQALRWLRALDLCRRIVGDRERDDLEAVLTDGTKRKKVKLALASRQPVYGPRPRPRPPGIDGPVGYRPLAEMDDNAARLVREWMPRLKETTAIVIDVRGNGGGTRDALLELHPWLADTRVASVSKHRLAFPAGHLDARFMMRADDPRLAEKDLVKAFLAAFKPEWEPPPAKFSDWHVLLLSGGAAGDRYAGRILVLMDDRCFSATDIFLGALKGLPNVTLVGRASGGGSGFKQSFTLPRSGIEVRCASMASFTPAGQLYDRRGIEPDVALEPAPEYFLEGHRDEVLEKARDLLAKG
ncbi:MAG: S41 family peptidase [Planctomycetota bacterium]